MGTDALWPEYLLAAHPGSSLGPYQGVVDLPQVGHGTSAGRQFFTQSIESFWHGARKNTNGPESALGH